MRVKSAVELLVDEVGHVMQVRVDFGSGWAWVER